MRIQHNIPALNGYRNYSNNGGVVNKNLEKLSSGYRINRAGDDAAGLAISEKMRAQITGLKTAQQNAKNGIGLIQTAEGALTEVHSMLNRMFELAEQSANGTYASSVDRKALNMEVDALKNEIDRIGGTANFNGRKLFSSSAGLDQLTLVIGETPESQNRLVMSFADVTASGVSLSSGQVNSTNLGLTSVSISAQTAALSALSVITKAINGVSMLRGKLGAYQNRLEHTINNLSVMQENVQDAESTIRDTDVASEMMEYTKNNIMLQSAQAMLAQANQQPQGVLQLLQ